MLHKTIYLISFVAVFATNAQAQKSLEKLTLSIIDTEDSKYEQAQDIYNWITHNIKYDLKKYKEFDNTLLPADELIKKKKGTCYDISLLFVEMCAMAEIDAFTVYGYSKGYNYTTEMPFLRGNHTWNVIDTKEKLVIADATWGMGYIEYKPSFVSKTLYLTKIKAYTSDQLFFVSKPDSGFFDILPNTITKTHYPLNPKWLLSESPISYNYFNNDSGNMRISLPYFEREIESSRGLGAEYQYKSDAICSNKHNPLNNFDIAWGYLQVANNYDLVRNITNRMLPKFEEYKKEFDFVYNSITRQREITDSIYQLRFKSLKSLSSTKNRLTTKIISDAKSTSKSYSAEKKSIKGNSTSSNKKIVAYMVNIGRSENKKMELEEPPTKKPVDSSSFKAIQAEIFQLANTEPDYTRKLDSLDKVMQKQIESDASLNDSIAIKNIVLLDEVSSLNRTVLSCNETAIRMSVDSLKGVYKEINEYVDLKKLSGKQINETGRQYYALSGDLKKNLKQELALQKKLFKLSDFNEDVLKDYNAIIDRLIAVYSHAISFTEETSTFKSGQINIQKKNLEDLKMQKKNIKKEHKYFEAWYNELYARGKSVYNKEKGLINDIRSEAQKKRKIVELKLKRYYSNQK